MRWFLIGIIGIVAFGAAMADGGNPADAIEEISALAEEGDPASMYRMAIIYEEGYDTISPDSLKSATLFRKAAEAGYVPAMNYLGFRLIRDKGDTSSGTASEGLAWIERAAMAGDLKAASNLGWLLSEGEYVERDYDKAVFWLEKASEGNLAIAQSLLAGLYADGKGMAPDTLRADSLYRKAFESGMADAGYRLAELNRERYQTLDAPDLVEEGRYYYLRNAPSEGVKLFYLAADKGDAAALALLGDAYSRAAGVPYDHDLSLSYFTQAALKGNPSAQFILGELLEIFPDALKNVELTPGEEISSDPFYWYYKAAESGVTDADLANRLLLISE